MTPKGCSPGVVGAAGFTLIELLVVVVIVAIVLVLGMPGFSAANLNTRMKAYANEMLSSVHLSRGEAIKRNTTLTMCASTTGLVCAAAGDWEQGWILLDPGGNVIQSFEALDDNFRLADASGGGQRQISFLPTGGIDAPVDLKLCRATPELSPEDRIISLAISGRARVETIDSAGTCP